MQTSGNCDVGEKEKLGIEIVETVLDKPSQPAIVKDGDKKRRFSRSGSVTFNEKSEEILIPTKELEEHTIVEETSMEVEQMQKDKLYKLSRDLDMADVHELLANRKEDHQDHLDNPDQQEARIKKI
eukprot:TRINITY_DN5459_c0_g1_i2.p1 TRINITY_DN5459_c0_g1~~TRINITY_DN5459_c0_g1_i2.p1  ORF type:complete len:126 (-),score=38.62 TRINITY_DN5459_c0_g1_i2:136-513(-)